MKCIYPTVLISVLLAGLSVLAQVSPPTSANGSSDVAIDAAGAQAAALRAASNAVQAVRIIRLTNQAPQTALAGTAGTGTAAMASASMAGARVATIGVSTNGTQAVRTFRLQSQPLSAARMAVSPGRATLAAGQTGGRMAALDSGPACVQPGSGLVSWWQGEWDATDSLGRNPGELINDATFGTGIVGEAFSFDGVSQAVEIPYSTNLATPSFSVEVWVKPVSQVGGWLGQAFIYGQSYGRQLVVRAGDQGLGVAWQISNDPWTFYEVDSSGEIPIGQWTHLVGTWDGVSLSLYTNGVLNQQSALDTFAWDSGCSFSIGAGGSCGPDQYFHGLIDEVSVYDRALFPGEINAIYQAGSAGKCKTPPGVRPLPCQCRLVVAGRTRRLRRAGNQSRHPAERRDL